MEYMEFKRKTKNDAITEACRHFSIPSDKLDYEVIDEGKTGFLGMGARPAIVRARVKEEEKESQPESVKLRRHLLWRVWLQHLRQLRILMWRLSPRNS